MTELFFNLIDEPWIPVLPRDGGVDEVSLMDVMSRGDEYTQIVGEVPTQVFAIQRLILAILHRAFGGPNSSKEWSAFRDDWDGAVDRVRAYLEPQRDRFYLFHPTTPFFQVAELRTAKNEVSGLEKLIIDVPNGTPFFTTRIGPGLDRIPFSEAARWLIHAHAFDPSGIRSGAVGDPRVRGGRGYPISPGLGWSGQIGGVSIVGDTVRETLQLNVVVPRNAGVTTGEDDRPPWERAPLTAKEEQLPGTPRPSGLVDLYTWQTRRIRLVRDAGGVIGLVLAQGDAMRPQNRFTAEPMTSWRYSEPQTKKESREVYMPSQHDPERQFWRGLASLLPHTKLLSTGKSRPPGVLLWASHVREELADEPDRLIRLRATGIAYGSNNSTVAELVDDQLELPLSLLGKDAVDLEDLAVIEVDRVEVMARAIGFLARDLARAAGARPPDDDSPRQQARAQFYVAVGRPFRRWLAGLSIDVDPLVAASDWQRQLRTLAGGLADGLIEAAGPAAWKGREVDGRLMNAALAEVKFLFTLSKAFAHDETEEEGDG